MSELLVKQDAPMDAYRQLFDGILSQRLAPGTKLNEVELTLLFGVSRTLIRQALQRLQLEQQLPLVLQVVHRQLTHRLGQGL